MLIRLPIERSVYVDFEKISGVSDWPKDQSFIMVVDGAKYEFFGDDYQPVREFVLGQFDGKTFEQLFYELVDAGKGHLRGSYGYGTIWHR